MKTIQLTRNKVTIVDGEDYDNLNKYKWQADFNNGRWYAIRKDSNGNTVRMHQQIMKTPSGLVNDHISGDSLDNRRENLRNCTISQNNQNRKKSKGTSIYCGVSWNKPLKKWICSICKDNKRMNLGYFDSERLAAVAYNIAALRFYGIDARLNNV